MSILPIPAENDLDELLALAPVESDIQPAGDEVEDFFRKSLKHQENAYMADVDSIVFAEPSSFTDDYHANLSEAPMKKTRESIYQDIWRRTTFGGDAVGSAYARKSFVGMGSDGTSYLDPKQSLLPWEVQEKTVSPNKNKKDSICTIRRADQDGNFTSYLRTPLGVQVKDEPVKKTCKKGSKPKYGTVFVLATPKGEKSKSCEVCNIRATIMCLECRVTFYCNEGHLELDSDHPKVCSLLRFIRSSAPKNYTKFERLRFQKQLFLAKQDLVERLMWQGVKALAVGKYNQANASLNQAMLYAKNVLGSKSVEVIRLCILKAQASLMVKDIGSAESELTMAKGVMFELKNVNQDSLMNSEVAKTTALIEMANGKWDMALFYFSEALIQLSELNQHDSIKSARIYFHMGEVFYKKGQKTVSESMFIHSLENYTAWLFQIYQEQVIQSDSKQFNPLGTMVDDSFMKAIPLPINLESECLSCLKKLHRLFRRNKDQVYANCMMSFGLLAFFKVMPKECTKFLDVAKPYTNMNNNEAVLQVTTDAHRRCRKFLLKEEKIAKKTLHKWKKSPSIGMPGPGRQF